jgi:hypothetical protein
VHLIMVGLYFKLKIEESGLETEIDGLKLVVA